mmetsp:Transcript_42296/g.101100  ORF Transcript_42296/g.101100 Transcript_42296/m.101100 type:complete len:326 (-) Transcript_42296:16-993(-)
MHRASKAGKPTCAGRSSESPGAVQTSHIGTGLVAKLCDRSLDIMYDPEGVSDDVVNVFQILMPHSLAGNRQEGVRSLECSLHLIEFVLQPSLFELLQLPLHLRSEEGVQQAGDPGEGGWHEEGVDAHVGVQVGPQNGPAKESCQDREQHKELHGVIPKLHTLELVGLAAPAAVHQEDHGRPASSGTNVCGSACDVRRAHNRAEVHGAHSVLQATGHRRKATGSDDIRLQVLVLCNSFSGGNACCCNKQATVPQQSDSVEGLATKMHLVLGDDQSTKEGPKDERAHQQRAMEHIPVNVPASRQPLNTHPHARDRARHVAHKHAQAA